MADLSDKMKKAWLKGMEAIGNTAGSIASNTRYKVSEMNLLNRRREILSDFGARAYALWQKGEAFPEELSRQLEELSQVDKELNALRTERLAGVKTDGEDAEGAPAAEGADENEAEGRSPLAEKADQAIDALGSTLKNVGSALGSAFTSVAGAWKKPAEEEASQAPEEAAEAPAPQADAAPTAAQEAEGRIPVLVVPDEPEEPQGAEETNDKA